MQKKTSNAVDYASHPVSKPNEPQHDKTNKMTSASSEGSDQPGHTPSLIKVFAVRLKKFWALNWAAAQADLNLRWAHWSFCWFCHAVVQILC